MKYQKLGSAITTPLTDPSQGSLPHIHYLVRANIVRESVPGHFRFTLELCRSDIGQYQLINDDSAFRIESKNISTDVAVYIENLNAGGYFSPYIERYEYWLACMNIGNEVLEHYSGQKLS